MTLFTQSPHQPRLYVADPVEDEAGWIGYVLPEGGEGPNTTGLGEALQSECLRGSFVFLSVDPGWHARARAASLVDVVDSLVRWRQYGRLLIWINNATATPADAARTAVLARIDDAGSAITDGFSADLVGDLLRLVVGMSPNLALANDETALAIGRGRYPILFQGKQRPKGRASGGASLVLKGRERGCIRFGFEMERSSLTDELPCGFEFFVPDQGKDGAVRQQWYPLFDRPADGAGRLRFFVCIDVNAPFDRSRTYFAFTEPEPPLASFFRTRFGHPVCLAPVPNARLFLTTGAPLGRRRRRARLQPEGDFEIQVGDTADGSWHDLLCGLAGTETICAQSRGDGTPGDRLRFIPDQPAYAQGFPYEAASPVGPPFDPNADLLDGAHTTSWTTVLRTADSGDNRYSAQPMGNWLYGKDGRIHPAHPELLGFVEPGYALPPEGSPPFPMVPYGGVEPGSQRGTFSREEVELFERSVLSPQRRAVIAATRPPAAPPSATRRAGSHAADPYQAATPTGLVVTGGPDGGWEKLLLGQTAGENGLQFRFDFPRPSVQAVFQTSDLFLVVANATELGSLAGYPPEAGAAGEPRFHNALTFDGWALAADVGQTNAYADYDNVLIVKGRKGRLADLVSNPNVWTDARRFAAPGVLEQTEGNTSKVSDPDPAQLVVLAQWLQAYLTDAAKQRSADFENFSRIARDETWTGILVLKARIAAVPDELAGLIGGADPKRFFAHHFGIAVTTIDGDRIDQAGDSATFGLISYVDPDFEPSAEPKPVPPEPGATYDFKVLMLRVLFENAAVKRFQSVAQLTLNELFGEPVARMGDPENLYNSIVLQGAYESQEGAPTYVLNSVRENAFYLNSAVVNKVEIVKARFRTVSDTEQEVKSRFGLWGFLDFRRLEAELSDEASQKRRQRFDVFSFGSPYQDGELDDRPRHGLRFSGLAVEMTWRRSAAEERPQREMALDPASIVFDPRQSTPREGSLYRDFALELDGLVAGEAGSRPDALGYLGVLTEIPLVGVGERWHGLRFRLNMGSPGELAGKASLTSQLLLAWSPGGAAEESSLNVQVGLKLPGTGGGASVLSLQGALSLSIGSIRLRYFDGAADKPGGFMLVLSEIALKFLGLLKIPPNGATAFYLFGNPEAQGAAGKLGWYAIYNRDDPKRSGARVFPIRRPDAGDA